MRKIYLYANLYNCDADSFVVEDGVFSYVGLVEESLKYKTDKYEIIDLKGNFVCPGFNDSHMHLIGTGYYYSCCQLQDCKSLNDVADNLLLEIADKQEGEWIIGRGWNQDNFDKVELPTKAFLDKISMTHPICITRCCGHIAVANSCAMELAKINGDTIIENGEVDYEKGIFKELAIDLLHKHFPSITKEKLKEYITKGSKVCNKYGITSCQSDDFVSLTDDFELPLEAFDELSKENKLTVRINEQCQFLSVHDFKKFLNLQYKNKGDYFKIGPLKMLGDGSLGARTAFLSKPYNDDPATRGIANYTETEFAEMVELAYQNKMGSIIHSIGDGILDRILSVFEKTNDLNNSLRSGLVHVQLTRQDQLDKIIKMKLHCYIQSIFIDYDAKIVKQRVGELADTSYAFKTLYENTTVSNGSDSPVENPDCLKGIECAVTRCSIDSTTPYRIDESLTINQAIDSFTSQGAVASFEENIKGKIEKGMFADFVILSEDPRKIDMNQLHNIKIKQTILGGKVVYSNESIEL